MNTYWIMWTYVANHSERPVYVNADTAEAAIKYFIKMMGWNAPEFVGKATVYAFPEPPAAVLRKGVMQ